MFFVPRPAILHVRPDLHMGFFEDCSSYDGSEMHWQKHKKKTADLVKQSDTYFSYPKLTPFPRRNDNLSIFGRGSSIDSFSMAGEDIISERKGSLISNKMKWLEKSAPSPLLRRLFHRARPRIEKLDSHPISKGCTGTPNYNLGLTQCDGLCDKAERTLCNAYVHDMARDPSILERDPTFVQKVNKVTTKSPIQKGILKSRRCVSGSGVCYRCSSHCLPDPTSYRKKKKKVQFQCVFKQLQASPIHTCVGSCSCKYLRPPTCGGISSVGFQPQATGNVKGLASSESNADLKPEIEAVASRDKSANTLKGTVTLQNTQKVNIDTENGSDDDTDCKNNNSNCTSSNNNKDILSSYKTFSSPTINANQARTHASSPDSSVKAIVQPSPHQVSPGVTEISVTGIQTKVSKVQPVKKVNDTAVQGTTSKTKVGRDLYKATLKQVKSPAVECKIISAKSLQNVESGQGTEDFVEKTSEQVKHSSHVADNDFHNDTKSNGNDQTTAEHKCKKERREKLQRMKEELASCQIEQECNEEIIKDAGQATEIPAKSKSKVCPKEKRMLYGSNTRNKTTKVAPLCDSKTTERILRWLKGLEEVTNH